MNEKTLIQLTLRLPEHLKLEIEKKANEKGISLNAFILSTLHKIVYQ